MEHPWGGQPWHPRDYSLPKSQRKDGEEASEEVIRFGNWGPAPFITQSLLEEHGPDWETILSKAQFILEPILNFENVARSTWKTSGNVSLMRDLPDGRSVMIANIQGEDGISAIGARILLNLNLPAISCSDVPKTNDALETLLSAISKGLAVLIAFSSNSRRPWNQLHPDLPQFD